MIYIIDIDNTICKTNASLYEGSQPYPEKIKKINQLYDDGHKVIYWTARGSSSGLDWSELTEKQLKSWGCKYHELRLGKPSYDIWVDDKAINEKDFFSL
jgi:hypothetical protein